MTGGGAPVAQPLATLLDGLPGVWPRSLVARIRRLGRDRTLVILDDDPTGTQTVRGVRVLVDPSSDDIARVLADRPRAFFILTNSRSLPEDAAARLARRLGARIRVASTRSRRPVTLVSRSDSTLRGHFPAEVDALAAAAGLAEAPVLFMPYLGEAGRLTVDDVHYLVRGATAVPVAETEFARDPAFGYRDSNLEAWLAARLGAPTARPIISLPLEQIRIGGPKAVAQTLRTAPPRSILIANAADDRDAEVVAAAMAEVEPDRALLARTAAGYVRARAGQVRQGTLGARALRHAGGPGLVVVGSHVPTTTRQLESLLADPPVPVELVEVAAAAAADPRRARRVVRVTVAAARRALDRGVTPVVATSRELLRLPADDPSGLRLAARVSGALARVVGELEPRPAWIIAKGGITSSDVASSGLGVREAVVVGPLLPGVPVWRVRRTGRRTVLLVVFPGNVGDDAALRSAVAALAGSPDGAVRAPG